MLTYLKLLTTMAFWGGTFIAGRLLGGVIPPVNAAFLRFTVASLILLALLRRTEGSFPRLTRAQLLSIILLGLTGVVGYNLAFFKGLETVSASRAGLIIALNPVGIALLSALSGKESLRPLRVLGVLVSLVGAVLIISRGQLSFLDSGAGRGELILLGCVLCWALYSVVGRHTMQGLSPLTAVTYSATAGTLFLAPLVYYQGGATEIFSYGFKAYASILYLAVFGTVIGFLWYYQAIRSIGAVRSGVFINFVPLFSMLFGVVILGETLTPTLLQGGILVVIGAWLTNNINIWRKGPV